MLLDYLYIIPLALLAIIVHEFSHGLVSYWLGDPTPKEDGRLSFNPLNHIDWFGIIALILFKIGWAKPVRINVEYYKNKKIGTALVSLAGPLSNLILAFIFSMFYVLVWKFLFDKEIYTFLSKLCSYGVGINVGLGLFNLIPIPPLDGSKILAMLLPSRSYERFMYLERYGFVFILGLIILFNVISFFGLPNLLSDLMDLVANSFVNIWVGIFK